VLHGIDDRVNPMLVALEWNHREKRIKPTSPTPRMISLEDISVPRMFISVIGDERD
jgi:hypothetical protein